MASDIPRMTVFRFDDAEVGRRLSRRSDSRWYREEFPRALLTGSGAAGRSLLVGKREVAEVTTLIMGPAEGGDGSSNGAAAAAAAAVVVVVAAAAVAATIVAIVGGWLAVDSAGVVKGFGR